MPRIRTIKPEFATDEKLAKVSRDARLTFVLCITQADDDGLLPGNHRQLLASLYPLDDQVTFAKLAGWLEELVELGRLRWRETVDGSPILEIVNWSAHQKVDHKGKSLILPHLKPAPEDGASDSRDIREDDATDSRSDLGPRTVDQGPTTKERGATSSRGKRGKKSAPAPVFPLWVDSLTGRWARRVGKVSPALVQRELSSANDIHGEDSLLKAIDAYADARLAAEKPCRLEWFASEAAVWVQRTAPIVDPATGTFNERGMALFGGKA